MGDRKPYIYKTADYGKTWQKIVSGIPDTDFPRVIREDIKRKGMLYVGTELGIYISFNDGAVVAIVEAGPADHAGARHRLGRARPGDRHARPRLLRARQHRRAAPGDPGADQQPVVPVRAAQPDARARPQRHLRLLPERRSAGSEDRVPRLPPAPCCAPSPGRRRRRPGRQRGRLLRGGAGAGRHRQGHQPLHLGHALRRRDGVPRHDHVGGAAAARAGRADRALHRARHRQRHRPPRASSTSRSIRGWSPTASPRPTCSSSSGCRCASATRSAKPTRR